MNDPRGLDKAGMHFRPADASSLRGRFARVRALTQQLVQPLSAEDACVQSMPDASPAKWHLAHTTWFFETFLLEKYESGFRPFLAEFRVLFNSYYNGVGDKHPRPQRGLLTRPALAEVQRYRQDVESRLDAAFDEHGEDPGFRALVELGLHHEQQHQELILTDIKHLLAQNPLYPAYAAPQPAHATPAVAPLAWTAFEGGLVEVGHAGDAFSFDNELPRHRQFLQPYAIASRAVTNGEYAEFVADGSYAEPRLWLSEGWDWLKAHGLVRPIYWQRDDSSEFTLHGLRALEPALPVTHLSYFEADAFARWAGTRLPTEAEWEHAAAARPVSGNFLAPDRLHPQPATGEGLTQMFGDVWEWTQSSYAPYPGFRSAPGAIGEYNGKFMVNQYVLRGGSCATPDGHVRASYRNFFPATARWQFSGLRLAR